jgi:hypothetical protein
MTSRPETERADSFALSVCDDPDCGVHLLAMRADDSEVCEIVISRQQLRGMLGFALLHGLITDGEELFDGSGATVQ